MILSLRSIYFFPSRLLRIYLPPSQIQSQSSENSSSNLQGLRSKAQEVMQSDLVKPQAGKGKTVLVTGGSGFVASHIVNAFLSRGYYVRTTVRSQDSVEKVKAIHGQYQDRLSFAIVKDIQQSGALDEAVKNVDGVIHTASPFVLSVENNERDLLNPAINGTTSVLHSTKNHAPTVTHVIILSSFASILDVSLGARPGYTYTEEDWNPTSYTTALTADGATAYCASKAFGERAAWDFVAQESPRFAITAICPPMVYGPAMPGFIQDLDKLNTSSADIYRLINGSATEVPPTSFFAFVDVRDVAEAHVRAFERPETRGKRFFCAAGTYTFSEMCEIIRREFPDLRHRTPEGVSREGKEEEHYAVDNGRCRRELGLEFRGLEETVCDMVREFKRVEERIGKGKGS